MALNEKLAAMAGVAALATTAPATPVQQQSSEATTPAPQVQQADASWYKKAWDYSGGLVGAGLSYAGQGISKVGEGISWTLDKGMYPIRKGGEIARDFGDTLAKGPKWVESKTGIPMETAASVVSTPTSMLYSFTDNASDLMKDLPKASLGLAGSGIQVTGEGMAANMEGVKEAGKSVGGNAWDLVKTTAGDALPLGLQAAGMAMGGAGAVPYTAIARDTMAGINRATDAVTGQTDLSKPVPTGAVESIKYTVDRAIGGKEYADYNKGNLFSNSEPPKEQTAKAPAVPEKPVAAPVIPSAGEKTVQTQKTLDPQVAKVMADRQTHGG